jgi:hypothetical protein
VKAFVYAEKRCSETIKEEEGKKKNTGSRKKVSLDTHAAQST